MSSCGLYCECHVVTLTKYWAPQLYANKHKAMIFPVVMNRCESWNIKKAECRIDDILEKTVKSPLDGKEIKTVNAKGNQPCIFIGKTDAEDESPILWPPNAKS